MERTDSEAFRITYKLSRSELFLYCMRIGKKRFFSYQPFLYPVLFSCAFKYLFLGLLDVSVWRTLEGVLIAALPFFVGTAAAWLRLKKSHLMRPHTLTVEPEQGLLEIENGDRERIACSRLGEMKIGRRLILLPVILARNLREDRVIPAGAFSSEAEWEEFLRQLEAGKRVKPERAEKMAEPEDRDSQERVSGNSRAEPPGFCDIGFSFHLSGGELCSSLAQNVRRARKDPYVRRRLVLSWFAWMAAYWWLCCVMLPPSELRIMILLGLCAGHLYRVGYSDTQSVRFEALLRKGKIEEDLLTRQEVRLGEKGISVFRQNRQMEYSWEYFSLVADLGKVFCFCDPTYSTPVFIPRRILRGRENEEKFLRYCARKGLVTDRTALPYAETRMSSGGILMVGIVVGVFMTLVVLTGAVNMLIRRAGQMYEEKKDEAAELPFVFDPSDYPGYVPFDEQLRVLESLDIHIPKEDAADYREMLAEDGEYRINIEGYPYTGILSYAGYGIYDEDVEETRYCDSVYSLEFEVYDGGQDYVNALEGIDALGRGEFCLADIVADESGADWEKGNGELFLMFSCNGHPYRFRARVDYDWLDERIVKYINRVLEKEGLSKRIYCMKYDWGAVLFYNTKEWAEEFTAKTGKELSEKIEREIF